MRLEKERPGAVDEHRGKGSSHAVPREGWHFFTNYARFYSTGNSEGVGNHRVAARIVVAEVCAHLGEVAIRGPHKGSVTIKL